MRRAMTLVEVLVASVLLGAGVAGLISAATLGMRGQQRSERRAAALQLAQETLAQVDLVGAHTWALAQPTTGSESREDAEYSWNLQIEQTAVAELFRVHVTVQWAAAEGSGSVEIETLLNDYEAAALIPQNQRQQPVQPQGNVPG